MNIYSYAISNEFKGYLNCDQFKDVLLADTVLKNKFQVLTTEDDLVQISFDTKLLSDEKSHLDELIDTLVSIEINEQSIFDAIVDSKYNGHYQCISDAFADGKTSVYVRDGIYFEKANIIIPNGGQLKGESQGNVKIVLGNYSVIIDGSQGINETVGSISISNGSQMVTGIGTNFQSIAAGAFILISTNYFEIKNVIDDFSLELTEIYQGSDLINISYIAHTMYTGTSIENIILSNSTQTALDIRAIRHSTFKGIAVISSDTNIRMREVGDSSFSDIISQNAIGNGFEMLNCVSVLITCMDVYNCTANGIVISGTSHTDIFETCSSTSNGQYGVLVKDHTSNIKLNSSIIQDNLSCGIHIQGTATDICITCCHIKNNGQGIKISSAGTICIDSNIITNNTLDGINTSVNSNIAISNNTISKNSSSGINIQSSGSIQVTNNRILYNTIAGLTSNSPSILVNGNSILHNTITGIEINGSNAIISNNNSSSNFNGIVITSDQCIVTNNQLLNNTDTGITVANNCIVSLNVLKSNSGNLTETGTNNVIINNIII